MNGKAQVEYNGLPTWTEVYDEWKKANQERGRPFKRMSKNRWRGWIRARVLAMVRQRVLDDPSKDEISYPYPKVDSLDKRFDIGRRAALISHPKEETHGA